MKKAILILSIVIAIVFALAYRTEDIGYVNISCSDDNGSFYLVEDSLKLNRISEDGKITLELQLPKLENKHLLEYESVSVNKDGVIYFVVSEVDGDDEILNQWIDAYDANGDYVARFLETNTQLTGETIFEQNIVEGVSTVTILDNANNTLKVVNGSLVKDETQEQNFIFDQMPEFTTIELTSRGEIYYSDIQGDFYCLSSPLVEDNNFLVDLKDREISIIVDVASDTEGNVYLYDAYRTEYIMYDPVDGSVEVLFAIGSELYDGVMFEQLGIPECNGGTVYSLTNPAGTDTFNLVSVKNEDVTVIDGMTHSFANVVLHGLIAFVVALAAVSLLTAIVLIRKNTRRIWVKQIYAITPIVLIGMFYAMYANYTSTFELMENETKVELYITCQEMISKIDGDFIEDLDLPLEYDSDVYAIFESASSVNLEVYYEMYPDVSVKPIDREIYITRDGFDYCVYRQSDNEDVFMLGYNTLYIDAAGISVTSDYEYSPDGTFSYYKEENASGQWTVCDMYILNSAGEKVGSICASFDNTAYWSENRISYIFNGIAGVLIAMGICFVLFMSLRRLLSGFNKLGEGVELVASGKWDTLVQIDTNDEMEDIANSFNIMARKVESNFEAMSGMSMAYEKFVQREMMNILGKDNILEFKPGDYIMREMNILSIFARDYHLVNGELTKEESFDLANRLYAVYAGVVRKKGGFIEAYSDGDMKVVFAGKTDIALDAILEIKETLANQGLSAVNMRAVISRGNMMFGIVGDENRMSTVTSSDAYSAVQQLNILANKHKMGVVLNQAAYEAVENKNHYECRYIGNVEKNKDITGGVHIYDIITGYDLAEQRERKLCKDIFEKGVRYYVAGELKLARACFIDVVGINRDDEVAKAYIFLCDRFKNEVDETWQGHML